MINYSLTPKELKIFADYFSIVHHSNGRIRLRASSKLKDFFGQNSEINPQEILESLQKSPAIRSVKFNKIIGSLTIEYDISFLSPSDWELCIKGENLEAIAQKINALLQEI